MKQRIPHILLFIALIIIGLLLSNKCSSGNSEEQPIVKTRVVYKTVRDTVIKKVTLYKSIPTKPTKEFTPSSNCDSLKAQYISVRDEFIAKNIFTDTIKLDTLGNIRIIDTLQFNKIISRKVITDYKLPTVIKEITYPAKARTQVYIGGNVYGSKQELLLITPGLLLKTKRDNIYQINSGVTFDGKIIIGAGVYWKIKLKN